jgi:hypothetical protein
MNFLIDLKGLVNVFHQLVNLLAGAMYAYYCGLRKQLTQWELRPHTSFGVSHSY